MTKTCIICGKKTENHEYVGRKEYVCAECYYDSLVKMNDHPVEIFWSDLSPEKQQSILASTALTEAQLGAKNDLRNPLTNTVKLRVR